MKPNIFKIATKELSQDAFFSWLLEYAHEDNEKYNEKLSNCAKEFINYLISKQVPSFQEPIKKIEVKRQWKNIDILAIINDNIFIIIEDKTNTSHHSNQLTRYKEIAKEYCKNNNYKEPICIYLKTGAESQDSLNKIETEGFSVIGIEDLLKIFNKYNIDNDIFNDFHTNLQQINEEQKSFETKLIKDWSWGNWQGFYTYLDFNLDASDANWNYVNSPSGGFLGFWWHWCKWENLPVYLQIEQGNLCFKIFAENTPANIRAERRNTYHKIILSKAKEENKNDIIKPIRFGNGNYMSVAMVEQKDWLGSADTQINKGEVVIKLKEYEKFLDRCVS